MTQERIKVLIVEDEPDFRNLIAGAFEAEECQVFVADNAVKAMPVFKEKSPQLVLSDIRFSQGPSGFDLLKALKTLNIESPVVALMTGFTDVPITEMYAEGASAVFSKPLNMQSMVSGLLQKVRPLQTQWAVKVAPPQSVHITKTAESLEKVESSGEFRLGRGGFYIHSSQVNLERGAWVTFTLTFESGPLGSLKGDGMVRWTRRTSSPQFKPGYGVEILHLEPSSLKAFRDLLPSRKSPAYIPSA